MNVLSSGVDKKWLTAVGWLSLKTKVDLVETCFWILHIPMVSTGESCPGPCKLCPLSSGAGCLLLCVDKGYG